MSYVYSKLECKDEDGSLINFVLFIIYCVK